MIVTAEVAIALILAIGSVLLVRSFQRLLQVNPGFGARSILTAHLTLPRPRYSSPKDQGIFCDRLLQALKSQPQIESTSLIDNMPLTAIRYGPFEIEGRPITKIGDAPSADYANLTAGFFETMGVPLRAGRLFTDADAPNDLNGQNNANGNNATVAVINETLARQFWPGQNPLGAHIRWMGAGNRVWATIVGVVADFVQFNVDTPPRPELFFPTRRLSSMTVVARTSGAPAQFSATLQRMIWEIDKDQPISDVKTLDGILQDSVSQTRFNMAALTTFAVMGVLLALVGVYGLTSYLVSSRTKEIGLRLALGAQRAEIVLSLLRQTIPFVGAGILIGIAGSLFSSKVMASLIFGITSRDLATYATAPFAVLVVTFITVLLPARRAIRIAPSDTLRRE